MNTKTKNGTIPSTATLLGRGVFTWGRMERVSDRYGAIFLMSKGGNSIKGDQSEPAALTIIPSAKGSLMCRVIETRDSTHIGDFFRGFVPSTPKVNAVINLGEGELFYATDGKFPTVGLKPDDGRASDWLNPKALYKCHEQTVELYFNPQ